MARRLAEVPAEPLISALGGWIAFTSDATNLVATDTNGREDCFLYDFAGFILVSRNVAGTASANSHSTCTAVNADRGFVVFDSAASDLVANDNNGWIDTFRSEVPNWGDWGCGALDIFADGFESGDTFAWSFSTLR